MARDERALGEVVDAHSGAVYGMARRILGDPAFADEVAQDTFMALWRRPGAFDPDRGTLRAFLLGVARNKAVDLVRKEQRLGRTKDALMAEAASQSGVPADDETIERRDEVTTALAQLSSVQKEALVLAYFGGRTYREVAEELEIPEGTAKTRLRDGLANLRQYLEHNREGR
ncbi:MAG: sigma-70 family RNA polymerase sigma factor [Actinomycetota bacterium]